MSETPIQQILLAAPQPKRPNNFSRKHASYLITGVVAGLLLGYVLFGNQTVLAPIGGDERNSVTTNKSNFVSPDERSSNQSVIVINTQRPGGAVFIRSIVMTEPGWIAIHDSLNGQPGNILGAYYFPAGTHTDKIIPLLRAVIDGDPYLAVIHNDDGDRVFDHKMDLPRTSLDGRLQMEAFEVVSVSPRG